MFRAIASKSFPPFGEFQMDFPPVENKPDDLAEVHLLTGVNGTGKTRLLSLLAAWLGSDTALKKRLKGVKEQLKTYAADEAGSLLNANSGNIAGRYCLVASEQQTSRSLPVYTWAQQVPAFAYHGAAYISDAKISVMAGVPKPNRAECLSFCRPEKHSEALLQAISNVKVQAAMDSMNGQTTGASRSVQITAAIETALKEITGESIQFRVTTYPQPTLCVQWGSLDLPFDLLPDGLRSILGWLVDAVVMMDAWLQGEGSIKDTEAVFLLDEIESHLHPVWQRKVLPAFQRLFPKAQIFVATHSPFVIASLNHGWIHRLTLKSPSEVVVEKPVPASAGDSYISVLEDIMGLEEWYDPETERLLANFRSERDLAYSGNGAAKRKAADLANRIASRSAELRYTMGRELSQMERHLSELGKK